MAISNKLTDAQVRKAAPAEKPYKLFDGHSLYLHILPSGSKTWRMAYRLAGKPQTATFGPYPLLTLADARKKRDDLRRQLIDGADPRPKVQRRTPTVSEAVATYWTDQRQDVSASYRDNVTRGLARHLEGELGTRPIGELSKDELLATLNKVDAAGKHEYVRKVRVWIAQVLDWAVAQGWRADNPARAINPEKAFGKSEVVSHAALELDEVPEFMRRLNAEGQLLSVLAAKMLALTWVRTGELRMMRWDELEGELWRIPKGKMKRRRDHLVPLPGQAMALLVELKARARGDYVFPNDRRPDRPMSENSVLYLIGRIGYGGRMTGHGFRSVGSTWGNERGYNPDAIEMQLAHWAGGVRAVYNRAAYLPERRRLLQDWADWIDDAYAGGMKGGQAPAHRPA